MMQSLSPNNPDMITLRVIALARELALKNYHDRRAWLHDRWLRDSEKLWSEHKVVLSYPEFPAYPTEAELMASAKELFEIFKNPITESDVARVASSLDRPSGPEFPMEPEQPPLPEEPKEEPVPQEEPVTPPPQEEAVVDVEIKEENPKEEEPGNMSIYDKVSWILKQTAK